MTAPVDTATAADLSGGGHVCLVVTDDGDFADLATDFLADGNARGEKTVAFGAADSVLLARLTPLAAIGADPHLAFLGGRGLEPETMFAMFREQDALARREGYARLRVAADMDWLLSAAPSAEEIIGFEVLLDRVVAELGATVLCAYRSTSFDERTIVGTLCVHPVRMGHEDEPPFELVSGDSESWRLRGAVDMSVAAEFAGAFAAAAKSGGVVDMTGLEFIDVAGMRAIAQAARSADVPVQVRARRSFERYWQLAGFHEAAPTVHVSS